MEFLTWIFETTGFRARWQLGQMVRLIDDLLDVNRIACNKPELRRDQVELAPIVQQPPEPTGEKTLIKPRRILVVDDNRATIYMHSTLLTLSGNEVQTAQDGLEALEKAEKFQPDVILLDIGLPKLNGYDTCRAIRRQPWGKDIVIIALSGYGQEEDLRQSQEAGFDHHLVKPADHATLQKMIEKAPKS